jgi:hypothetical protein
MSKGFSSIIVMVAPRFGDARRSDFSMTDAEAKVVSRWSRGFAYVVAFGRGWLRELPYLFFVQQRFDFSADSAKPS